MKFHKILNLECDFTPLLSYLCCDNILIYTEYKLNIPMDLTNPSSTAFSISAHVSL